jgi:hypothetical protein
MPGLRLTTHSDNHQSLSRQENVTALQLCFHLNQSLTHSGKSRVDRVDAVLHAPEPLIYTVNSFINGKKAPVASDQPPNNGAQQR